jgi:hypothetical protein
MKNPFRFWMTGGAAMVLAALSGSRAVGAEEPRHTLTRISRYDMEETVSRIASAAQRHGLPVMARLPQHTSAEQRLVIVLESSLGGTPVSMDAAYACPELLLSLVLQQMDGGATQVFLRDSAFDELPEDMSAEVAHDVADLPALVDEALAA